MKLSFDPKSLKAINPMLALAVLAFVAAAWFAWQGWQARGVEALADRAGVVRAQAAAALGREAQAAIDQLEGERGRIALATAIKRGEMDNAKDLVREGWDQVEAVEWHPPGLEQAYEDPEAFGFGKLGLLEAALVGNRSQLAIVKDAGEPKLALAAPVLDNGQVLTLLYVRLPLSVLESRLDGSDFAGGYLALRQGSHSVVERGDVSLASSAEIGAQPVPGTPLRIAVAVPAGVEGATGSGTHFLLALLAAVVGGTLLVLPKLRGLKIERRDAVVVEDLPTLAELQRSGKLEPEPPAPAVAGERPPPAAPAPPPPAAAVLDRSIFRAYDIRGVVGKTLDADTARLIGQAIGTLMHEQDARTAVVGRDGRLSSPQLAEALVEGLRQAGRDVVDIGAAPTPVVYFGAYQLRAGSCVSVTGSHNPPDYNGFKIVVDGETLAGEAIQDLYARIAENRLHTAETPGMISRQDIAEDYIQRIAGDIQIERKLKVVVDCGSGIPGDFAPRLLEAIGAEVEPLFCEVDGTFPHHHPDPSDPDNLRDLIDVVRRTDADLGLAFDGDGDRLGVVTRNGDMIYPDRLLMLFAADVLERNPGACIIYDVKCTGDLAMHVLRHGGSPLMWKTGHSLIKAKMRETEAELAGEMSGHFFFRERWYGFDDGMYAAARLLEILSSRGDSPQEVFDSLPSSVSTPELKIPVEEGEQYAFIEKFLAAARFEGARIATIDGLRADWPDGWGLVRASNTTPVLVLRFDARDADALARVQEAFREQLLAVDPGLALPF